MDPIPDDRFGFPSVIAGNPPRIDVGRVDTIKARLRKGIQKFERGPFINRPPENIPPKDQRCNLKLSISYAALLH
jgi:hypothetical protein